MVADIYVKLASQIFNLPEDKITDDLRRQAKRIGFGQIYNQSNNLHNYLNNLPKENQ